MKINLNQLLIEYGYNKEEASRIITYSLNALRDEQLYNNIIRIYNNFLKRGYSKTEIRKMSLKFPLIYRYSASHIESKIDFFIEKGYSKNVIKKMFIKCPSLLSFSDDTLERKREYLKGKGYSDKQINKMTTLVPSIYSFSEQYMDKKRNYLLEQGYSNQDINKMTIDLPQLYGINKENIEEKRKYLLKKGYNEEDIHKLTVSLPSIYGYSVENIESKRSCLKECGYDEEEINTLTVNLPALYGCSEENISKKIWYFNLYGMNNLILEDTLKLMQSVELTYARSCFLVSSGYTLEQSTFKYLFLNAKMFEQKFGVTKEEVRELYPYEEYEENLILGGYIQKTKQKKKVK